MSITVHLFGPQAALVGARQVTVETPGATATVGEVIDELRRTAPALAPSLSTSQMAINHEFAAENQPIDADDEVALIGMVSGG